MSREESLQLLTRPVVVEEKADGLNVGLRVKRDGTLSVLRKDRVVQWRDVPELALLATWGHEQRALLRDVLGNDLTLFGEWVVDAPGHAGAPPLFVFDVYQRSAGHFRSRRMVDGAATRLGLPTTPVLFCGTIGTYAPLHAFLGPSRIVPGLMEGVVLRVEDGPYLIGRFKFVRPGYVK
jgi:hypothetical protein